MIRVKEEQSNPTIEMTPLIDMVFLLLIFFLVATTFEQQEREMKVALPVASSAGPISGAMREIIINVLEDGSIRVSGTTMSPESLRGLVERSVASNPDQKVTLRGDRNAVYASIVAVLDICKGAGIQEPFLDTVIKK